MTTITPMAWVSWGMVTFFYAFQYIIRVFPSVMMPDIMAKFSLNASDFGTFSGAYYLGYSLMHIPLGIMLDKIGPKWVIPMAVILSVVGIVPLIYCDNWIFSVIGRFIIGAGSSAAILGVFKITQMKFPDKQFSKILGISVTIGLLGAIYGGLPVNDLTTVFGWQTVLIGIISFGFVLAAIIFVVTPNRKNSYQSNVLADLKFAMGNKQVIFTAVMAGLMVGSLEGFADVWGISYLINVLGIEKETASGLPSFIFLGMALGCPVLAYFAEKWNKYKEIIIFSAFYMAAAFMVILLAKPSAVALSILFFTIGFAGAYQVIIIYMNSKNVSSNHGSIVTSITNMVIMSFGYFFHIAISKGMDMFWDGQVIDNVPVYGSISYKAGLAVIPISLIIAGFGLLFVNDKTKVRAAA